MKKLITIFIICCLTLALVFSMASCGDNKDNKETQATQDTQSTDNNENTESEQNKETTCSHTWVDADCDTPKTCSICGATEGDALGHATEEDDGNCLTPIVCPRCNEVLTSGKTQHVAHADDGDCTTAVTCSGCAHIMMAAKAHTPNADDGDCTTDITCKDCSKVTTAGYKEHTPNADDGDCTTAITCQYCDVVTTEARNEHTGGTPTCTHGKICEVCGVEYDTTKNPDNHVFIDGVCACGELQTIDATEMTAEQLNAAVAELLASGVTDITIKMSADADM